MNKGLKIFLWILAGIASLVVIGFIVWQVWAKQKFQEIWNNITFSKPIPKSIDLQGISWIDLQNSITGGTEKSIVIELAMDIENKNDFEIPFSARLKSSYKGITIAETSTISGTIPAKSTYNASLPVTITFSGAQAQILIEKINGKKVPIDYSIDLSLWGIPVNWFIGPITNTYEL